MARDNTRATHADSPHIHRRPRRRAPSPIPRRQHPRTKTPASDRLPYIHFTTRAHRPTEGGVNAGHDRGKVRAKPRRPTKMTTVVERCTIVFMGRVGVEGG